MRTAIQRGVGALVAVVVGMAGSASPVLAAGGFTLFGDATRIHPGHNSHTAIQLRSTGTGFGGIDFTVPSGLTFAQVTHLGTDYDFTAASCGGGAPRFQIDIQGKNAFVYIGPPPNYTRCPPNVWVSTGNLATPGSFVDTSQLPGGTFYDTFASADLKYGSDTVTGIQLVTDAGWMFGTQTVLVDNVMVNAKTYTFESCKHGDCERDDDGENTDNTDDHDRD
jgi:hypothetical protein